MSKPDNEIDYLRISVTDRCNLRCMYCMPQGGISLRSHEDILTFEEIIRIVEILTDIGIRKVRITGGEPLIRKGVSNLIASLNEIPLIEEVSITTNGILLPFFARELKKAGLKRINVSLDTLQKDKFARIAGKDLFYQVVEGIKISREYGFSPLKVNMVVMRGINDDEIGDFVNFSLSRRLILRFIEFMKVTPLWNKDYFLPIEEVIKMCKREFMMERVENLESGPAVYYRIGNEGLLGFIKTDEDNCRECRRLRILSTGVLKVCLYENGGVPLRGLLRKGESNEVIRDVIRRRLEIKERSTYKDFSICRSYMYSVGG